MNNQPKNDEIKEKQENRKKIQINELTNSVITNLPPELGEMLKAARQSNNDAQKVASGEATAINKLNVVPVNLDNPLKPEDSTIVSRKPSAEIEQVNNRKKVIVNELTNSVISNLPPELAEMLKAARQSNNTKEEPNKLNIQSVPVVSMPPPVPPPPPPEKLKQRPDEMLIYETGSVFGIQVNEASRRDVLSIMQNISKFGISNPGESIFKYDDLGIVFYFGEGGNLQEITFSYPFEGKTSKGLKLEESITRAIEIYGQPKMKTMAGAIWNKFAVFLKDDIITTIRLRSS